MSGKDEKPKSLQEVTFPICSMCSNFNFWEGCGSTIGRIFFNPIKHQKSNDRFPVVIYNDAELPRGRIPTIAELANIVTISCNSCGHILGTELTCDILAKAVDYVVGQG
jgi:hypothetical protein